MTKANERNMESKRQTTINNMRKKGYKTTQRTLIQTGQRKKWEREIQ